MLQFIDAQFPEGANRRRHYSRTRVDKPHWYWLDLKILEYVLQSSRLSERRNHIRKKRAESETVCATLDGHVGIIADNNVRNWNAYVAGVDPEGPMGAWRQPGEAHTPMGFEVLRTARNAMSAQVVWTGANNTAPLVAPAETFPGAALAGKHRAPAVARRASFTVVVLAVAVTIRTLLLAFPNGATSSLARRPWYSADLRRGDGRFPLALKDIAMLDHSRS